MLASALAILLAAATTSQAKLPLRACVVQGVPAKCGTLLVPENRDTGLGPRIGLRVVVVPARLKPARPDAFAYLAGGPGVGASEQTAVVNSIWSGVHERHDIVLVDQRGTGGSHPLACPPPEENEDVSVMIRACLASLNGDPTQYGTAAAADDLEAVRAAVGYRTLNLYGISYGATLAQVYLARHPRSVRSMVLDGATLIDVPFFGRFAVNGQRALDLVARRCARRAGLRTLVPGLDAAAPLPDRDVEREARRDQARRHSLRERPRRRNPAHDAERVVGGVDPARRQHARPAATTRRWHSRSRLAATTRSCSGRSGATSAGSGSMRAAPGARTSTATPPRSSSATALCARTCRTTPSRPRISAASAQGFRCSRSSAAPTRRIRPTNIAGLAAAMPKARVVVLPEHGHGVGQYGCLPHLVKLFVDRGSAAALDVRCVRATKPPPFALR